VESGFQVIERKERETGIEPATSSLGKWATIESKEQSRLWHAFLAQEIAAFSTFRNRQPLNGIQMGYALCLVHLADESRLLAEHLGRNI